MGILDDFLGAMTERNPGRVCAEEVLGVLLKDREFLEVTVEMKRKKIAVKSGPPNHDKLLCK